MVMASPIITLTSYAYDMTLNLSSRSHLDTCLIIFNSLIYGIYNKGSYVTVSCSVQIIWCIMLPLPH